MSPAVHVVQLCSLFVLRMRCWVCLWLPPAPRVPLPRVGARWGLVWPLPAPSLPTRPGSMLYELPACSGDHGRLSRVGKFQGQLKGAATTRQNLVHHVKEALPAPTV